MAFTSRLLHPLPASWFCSGTYATKNSLYWGYTDSADEDDIVEALGLNLFATSLTTALTSTQVSASIFVT
jgi:hypothetical protein